MAFKFDSVVQEIGVWAMLTQNTDRYEVNAANRFVNAITREGSVELNDGLATLIEYRPADISGFGATSWIVFEYLGKKYKMEKDEEDSWDSGGYYSEPFEVVARPVNEVQYFKV